MIPCYRGLSRVARSITTMLDIVQELFVPPPEAIADLEQEMMKATHDPLLDTSEAPRFTVDDPGMVQHLQEHGYVVVRGILSPSERDTAEDLLWEFMGDSAGWKRYRPSTWTDESFGRMGQMAKGLINGRGVGQSDLSWFVRTRQATKAAFARIWQDDQLLTSFDGISIFRPWHRGGLAPTISGWFHVDQGTTLPGFQCVQGLVSLFDQGPETGGLVVVPGSHREFAEVCKLAQDTGDYISIPEKHPLLQQPRKLVSCRAGDLVLWDSRLIHCNTPSVAPPTVSKQRLLRAVVYVCMTPRAMATAESLQQRRQGYEIRVTTSHWPHRNVMGFGWGKAPPLSYETASAERRELI